MSIYVSEHQNTGKRITENTGTSRCANCGQELAAFSENPAFWVENSEGRFPVCSTTCQIILRGKQTYGITWY